VENYIQINVVKAKFLDSVIFGNVEKLKKFLICVAYSQITPVISTKIHSAVT